eukprot:CAMPEP_0113954844 /NCGR_PEP_ID=MMETSP0011_2-20120614/881_1 /TAXON_ID=101924 /ORGANISM="Rhodosorus marinus" /LENGTH=87 /DNA_ID=CAMNT_0000964223 /DNA_START=262 /DNA_END=525 /DNA_ORIENTATION=- /assembly_acc=CAM_ASM_000156
MRKKAPGIFSPIPRTDGDGGVGNAIITVPTDLARAGTAVLMPVKEEHLALPALKPETLKPVTKPYILSLSSYEKQKNKRHTQTPPKY